MSILVIWASPNTDGLTATAAENIRKGIEDAGAVPELLHLNRQPIRSCLACGDGWGDCQAKGSCVIAKSIVLAHKGKIRAENCGEMSLSVVVSFPA